MKRSFLVTAVAALLLCGTGAASWSATASGSAAALATTIGGGSTPSASAPLLGTNVTVSWGASSFGNGGAVAAYVVRRYDATTGAAQTVKPGCAGTVNGLSCTESGVPIGQWTYSVTPVAGSWRGAESGRSAAVTVPGI